MREKEGKSSRLRTGIEKRRDTFREKGKGTLGTGGLGITKSASASSCVGRWKVTEGACTGDERRATVLRVTSRSGCVGLQ